jgi:photosystem II stability/assembly factor-like uncharacterized protein
MTVNPKTIFLLLLLCFLSCADVLAQSWGQWTLSEPKYTHEELEAIFFLDSLQGWAGDEAGRVFHTTDGGESWYLQATGLGYRIFQIYFIDAKQGWISGYFGIFHTQDGGFTWNKSGPPSTRINTFSLHAFNANKIIFSGSDYEYYVTNNGGKDWTTKYVNRIPENDRLDNLFFLNSSQGWMNSRAEIFSSTDGGNSWSAIGQIGDNTQPYLINKLHFYSPLLGFAVTMGQIYRTTDGGRSWTLIKQHPKFTLKIPYSNYPYGYFTDGFFLDQNHFWISGADSIYRTSDGGASWEASPLCGLHHSIQFANANVGWCSGQSGSLCKTTDGGRTWRHIGTTVGPGYGPIAFDDGSTGFAVAGCRTTIIRTQDSGRSWQPTPIQTESPIVALKMADANHLWAITEHSKLYATTDGGNSWERIYAFLPDSIAASETYVLQLKNDGIPFQFVNAQLGYACVDIFNEESKTITTSLLKTTNGGKAWSKIHQHTAKVDWYYPQYKNISFIDSLHGWYILGYSPKGTITFVQTVDGGRTWQEIFHYIEHCSKQGKAECELGNGLHFFDINKGTSYSNASITTDGGKTWVKNNDLRINDQVSGFKSMSFIDSLEWWGGGDLWDKLAYTRDGGKNWQQFERKITFVDFKSRHEGWGSNEKGIWKFSGDPTSTNEARTTPPPTVAIYPNPVDDILTIQCHSPQATAIHLLDLQGRSIARQQKAQAGSFSLPVHDIPNGMYILQVHFQDGTQKGTKVVVQH